MPLPEGWPCKGPMLDLAVDLANRLLPAFNTTTGMPYGSVNLRYGFGVTIMSFRLDFLKSRRFGNL